MVNNGEKGLISSRRRVDVVGEDGMFLEKEDEFIVKDGEDSELRD
jgi:hypothetical protein